MKKDVATMFMPNETVALTEHQRDDSTGAWRAAPRRSGRTACLCKVTQVGGCHEPIDVVGEFAEANPRLVRKM